MFKSHGTVVVVTIW